MCTEPTAVRFLGPAIAALNLRIKEGKSSQTERASRWTEKDEDRQQARASFDRAERQRPVSFSLESKYSCDLHAFFIYAFHLPTQGDLR